MPFQSHCAVRGIHDTDPSPHPMKRHRRNPIKDDATCRLAAILIAALAILSCLPAASAGPLYFACAADNDLFRVASENGLDPKRFDSPQAAVEAAGARITEVSVTEPNLEMVFLHLTGRALRE